MFLNYEWALGQNCRAGAAGFGRIPAISLAGGEVQVGQKGKGFKTHLLVVSVGARWTGGGSPAMDRGGGHGSSARRHSGKVGVGWLGSIRSLGGEEGHWGANLGGGGQTRRRHGEQGLAGVQAGPMAMAAAMEVW